MYKHLYTLFKPLKPACFILNYLSSSLYLFSFFCFILFLLLLLLLLLLVLLSSYFTWFVFCFYFFLSFFSEFFVIFYMFNLSYFSFFFFFFSFLWNLHLLYVAILLTRSLFLRFLLCVFLFVFCSLFFTVREPLWLTLLTYDKVATESGWEK